MPLSDHVGLSFAYSPIIARKRVQDEVSSFPLSSLLTGVELGFCTRDCPPPHSQHSHTRSLSRQRRLSPCSAVKNHTPGCLGDTVTNAGCSSPTPSFGRQATGGKTAAQLGNPCPFSLVPLPTHFFPSGGTELLAHIRVKVDLQKIVFRDW